MSQAAINLPLMVTARICTTAIFMTYPACLNALLSEWGMSSAQGGMVQGAFTAAFALSLLGASYLCDVIGAKRVFNAANLLSGIAALIFAASARSFETALLGAALIGLAQGGTYTPAIMLASTHAPPGRGASAVGWILAGMSAGYVLSIALSTALLGLAGYETAFWVTAIITALGWPLGVLSVRRAAGRPVPAAASGTGTTQSDQRRSARLLIIGYIGHCWELFGAWAWMPAFLAMAIAAGDRMSSVELGLWTALALHASGFFASALSGIAADRYGVKPVLILFAVVGTVCSLVIGWLPTGGLLVLFGFAAIYGFAIIGDSAVLSSAMTETAPPDRLGGLLGLRSVLGVGAGALSPVLFGAALDWQAGAAGWIIGFSILALGGAVAAICAARL